MKMKTEEKRQAILEGAAQVFQELGFERTTMAAISARAGGSKATIYNYFSTKEELFFEIMSLATEAEFEAVHQAIDPATDNIATSLLHFGEKLLAFLYSPSFQAQRHLAIAESRRSRLGQLAYERGVLRSQKLMEEFLQAAMTSGKLRQANPHVATCHLYSLLESELLDRFLFQLQDQIPGEEIAAATGRAIEVFMAAYGPRSGGETKSMHPC